MSQDLVKEVLYYEHVSPLFALAVLGVAFLLGALHALGPGHGKSLMAAYLVSSQGRIPDAVLLALVLTASHVLVVVVVALLALWVTDFFWPERAARWFSLGSGVAVSGIGLWLLFARIRAVFKRRQTSLSSRGTGQEQASWHGGDVHERHFHHHEHEYHHAQGVSVGPRTWWGAISLGFSGGLVPCPKALVILLLAISMHKVPLGLALVASFSLGMAVVMVVLGVVVVRGARLAQGRLPAWGTTAVAVAGAVVIVALGVLVAMRSLVAS
ncbi:MAG: sulfite exporter TauE/SafE family protein [bacterium]|nr:sulfite exporter TauE/SafE family protein [candidate division KSB1 bacterium]MDH7559449.1 sulfite exporter TauE/SafE family protein [bacterium]